MPTMKPIPLGDGILRIGATGEEIDISCAVNNAKIAVSKDQADSTTKLCGTVHQGRTTYTYALSGNLDVDIADPAGFFALSQAEPGTECDFFWQPNLDTATAATGVLIIDPLDFGADEMGADMTSDFEFSLVGAPVYDYAVVPETLDVDELGDDGDDMDEVA